MATQTGVSADRTNPPGRVALIGPGGIGGAAAAAILTARPDASLTICARRSFDRLVVHGPGVDHDRPVRVVTDPAGPIWPTESAGPADLVLLATKAYQTPGAGNWLDTLCAPETLVAVLQNGVNHRERVEPLVGGATIVPVVVNMAAERTAPGVIEQRTPGILTMADDPDGRRLASWFADSPIEVRLVDDWLTAAWTKLAGNALFGSVGALTLRRNGVVAEPDVREFATRLLDEVAAVGRAEGAVLPDGLADQVIERSLALASHHTSSIAQDRRDGNPLEWEVRNAVVGRKGREHGIPTPLNDAVTALLRVTDAAFESDRSGSD